MAEGLFDKVYNPDVLSCLANLSNDEVFTPPEIANQMLDMLPQELFENPDTTFLDPACKSGVFLREIAKRLLKAQLPGYEDMVRDIDEKKRNNIPLDANDNFFEETLQKKVDHIFHKQLFGIAITELTSLLSRRSVYCSKYPDSDFAITRFETSEGNIRYRRCEHTWYSGKCAFCGASQIEYDRDETLETHAYEWIHTMRPEEIFNMNFDVVIGNPPYQLSTAGDENGAQAKPLYHKFVEQAKKLQPNYLTMIIPSRWFAGGWGLDDFRLNMMTDNKVAELHDFPDASDCFPGVEIKGGVCYFLWDKQHEGHCKFVTHSGRDIISSSVRSLKEKDCDILIRYNEAIDILHKVQNVGETTFDTIVSTKKPFGFTTNYKETSTSHFEGAIKLYANRRVEYVSRDQVTRNNDAVDKYKIIVPKAVGSGDARTDVINPLLCEPGACCTETYLLVGPFNSEEECQNVIAYFRTRFFHFLVTLQKNTQDCMKKVYSFVPVQDFSVKWTDDMLFKKYGFTPEEIVYINETVWPNKEVPVDA